MSGDMADFTLDSCNDEDDCPTCSGEAGFCNDGCPDAVPSNEEIEPAESGKDSKP